MAVDKTATAAVQLAQLLANDVQKILAEAPTLINTITDVSAKVAPGAVSAALPRVSGLSVNDMKDDGTESDSSGMTIGVDVLLLNKNREVSEYIHDLARQSTPVDLTQAFLDNAPSKLAEDFEAKIYTELAGASASSPDHIIAMSGAGGLVPTIVDIRLAAKLLDKQKVPATDRFLVAGMDVKHAIMAFSEVSAQNYGSPEAIRTGSIAQLYGFNLVFTNAATTGQMVAYHRSALGFAWKKQMNIETERQGSKARDFIRVSCNYGCKQLDSGKRSVLFNATGS